MISNGISGVLKHQGLNMTQHGRRVIKAHFSRCLTILTNLRKNEGFPTFIPCIPIPEYGQSNAPLMWKNGINRAAHKYIYRKDICLEKKIIFFDQVPVGLMAHLAEQCSATAGPWVRAPFKPGFVQAFFATATVSA